VALWVLAGAFAAVTAVYVGVVLGGGLLIGHTESPHVGLSVLATAIVALGLEPLRSRLEATGQHWLYAGRPAPYDVLSRFSETLTGDTGADDQVDLPLRMARLLAEGTGASWAQVWLMVAEEPQLAAAWPQEPASREHGLDADVPGLRSLDVVLTDRRLGVLRLRERHDEPLSPVEERLFSGLAAQAGLVLRAAQLRAELARRGEDLAALAEDLQMSRRRVVDAHDSERRRLEHDIHDGAQQHLVALVVNLRLAQTLTVRAPDRAGAVLAEQGAAVDNAIRSLVEFSRGIYPKILAEDGLAAAMSTVVSTSTIGVTVLDRGIGRYRAELETALYFCCVEAVQNAVKHAAASRIEVELDTVGDRLTLLVRDDGQGFDAAAVLAAGGLGNLRDRVDSVGGDLTVRTNAAGGTDVTVSVPVEPPVESPVEPPVELPVGQPAVPASEAG
jgi:signal transduction histidine kinase